MLATKETAPLALGCMLLALGLTRLVDRWRGESCRLAHVLVAARWRWSPRARGGLLFSSFLRHPAGVVDAVRAYGLYLGPRRRRGRTSIPGPTTLGC